MNNGRLFFGIGLVVRVFLETKDALAVLASEETFLLFLGFPLGSIFGTTIFVVHLLAQGLCSGRRK